MSPTPRRGPRRRGSPDGAVAVHVADEQADVAGLDLERWRVLAEDALAHEGVTGAVEATVLFVDRDAIAELNRGFLGGAGPTDVLSFPIDGELVDPGRNPDGGTAGPHRELAEPDELPLLLGDVVVCPAVAEANAPDHAGSLEDELALLVVHGLLHLLGHDHAEPDERRAMQGRERALLAECWGPLAADPWAALERSLGGGPDEAPPPAAGGHPAGEGG